MPKAIVTEQEKWKLPKDVPLPAQLTSVTEKEIPYKNKRTGADEVLTKWEWEFAITEGEYAGLSAWGESKPVITTGNKVAQWAETLRGTPFDIGEGLDTDDLLGLPCLLVVDNTEYTKKDGETAYLTPITDIFPAGDDSAFSVDPPFS